ncbi:MAG: NAD+ kinase [Chloroflexia bacterium]|nr:NAD+ kinase [Chloroflexia bacterium]
MFEKIIVVTRKTRLEELIARFNTRDQARFYIEHMGGNFAAYQAEHDTYKSAVDTLLPKLGTLAKLQMIERGFLPNFFFSDKDLVVTVGLDGLVVNTAKYLDGQPIVAVNPDPSRIDGILLPYSVAEAQAAAAGVMEGRARVRRITMAEACLNDGQRMLAFNDLFIGMRTHTSARYRISFGGRSERHSSSGVIVSTGAGSTGWLSSMFNMAAGIVRLLRGEDEPADEPIRLDWEDESLVFVVREPFVSKVSQAGLVAGVISGEEELVLESLTPENGVIFSDGVEADYIAFNSGAIAHVGMAEKKTALVVPER